MIQIKRINRTLQSPMNFNITYEYDESKLKFDIIDPKREKAHFYTVT